MFSIDFRFRNQSYTASVTTGSTTDSPISVYVPDERLHKLVPEGKLVIDGDKLCSANNSNEDDIKNCILKALQEHEENMPERNLWN